MWQTYLLCCMFTRIGFTWGVLDGIPTIPHSRPYIVQVHSSNHGILPGIIVNPCTILVKARDFNITLIRAGKNFIYQRETTEQTRDVCTVTNHPKFRKEGRYRYGWGLAHLYEPLILNEYVSTAKLAPEDFEPKGECRLIGWGSTCKNGTFNSLELRERVVKFKDMRPDPWACGGEEFVHESLVCIEEGACSLDTGAPMVCKQGSQEYVYGITAAYRPSHCRHSMIAPIPKMSREWFAKELENAEKRCGCNANAQVSTKAPAVCSPFLNKLQSSFHILRTGSPSPETLAGSPSQTAAPTLASRPPGNPLAAFASLSSGNPLTSPPPATSPDGQSTRPPLTDLLQQILPTSPKPTFQTPTAPAISFPQLSPTFLPENPLRRPVADALTAAGLSLATSIPSLAGLPLGKLLTSPAPTAPPDSRTTLPPVSYLLPHLLPKHASLSVLIPTPHAPTTPPHLSSTTYASEPPFQISLGPAQIPMPHSSTTTVPEISTRRPVPDALTAAGLSLATSIPSLAGQLPGKLLTSPAPTAPPDSRTTVPPFSYLLPNLLPKHASLSALIPTPPAPTTPPHLSSTTYTSEPIFQISLGPAQIPLPHSSTTTVPEISTRRPVAASLSAASMWLATSVPSLAGQSLGEPLASPASTASPAASSTLPSLTRFLSNALSTLPTPLEHLPSLPPPTISPPRNPPDPIHKQPDQILSSLVSLPHLSSTSTPKAATRRPVSAKLSASRLSLTTSRPSLADLSPENILKFLSGLPTAKTVATTPYLSSDEVLGSLSQHYSGESLATFSDKFAGESQELPFDQSSGGAVASYSTTSPGEATTKAALTTLPETLLTLPPLMHILPQIFNTQASQPDTLSTSRRPTTPPPITSPAPTPDSTYGLPLIPLLPRSTTPSPETSLRPSVAAEYLAAGMSSTSSPPPSAGLPPGRPLTPPSTTTSSSGGLQSKGQKSSATVEASLIYATTTEKPVANDEGFVWVRMKKTLDLINNSTILAFSGLFNPTSNQPFPFLIPGKKS